MADVPEGTKTTKVTYFVETEVQSPATSVSPGPWWRRLLSSSRMDEILARKFYEDVVEHAGLKGDGGRVRLRREVTTVTYETLEVSDAGD